MHGTVISRRLFLAGGIGLSARSFPSPNQESVYEFDAAGWKVRMTVEFYDRYSSSGFSFRDLSAGRHFCLSAMGKQDRDCAAGFIGSLAIARYSFRPLLEPGRSAALREHVRTIDQDIRLPDRPPFDRVIELREGVASDIQAFGYETASPSPSAGARVPASGGPWYYFRQDLYLAGQPAAFLAVHWRHTVGAIRILDVIPGDGTLALNQALARNTR
jgi:hypothetical protein